MLTADGRSGREQSLTIGCRNRARAPIRAHLNAVADGFGLSADRIAAGSHGTGDLEVLGTPDEMHPQRDHALTLDQGPVNVHFGALPRSATRGQHRMAASPDEPLELGYVRGPWPLEETRAGRLSAVDAMHTGICRVLAPGGKVDVLEPCGFNPLIALHALTHPVERLELRSNGRYLRSLLGERLQILALRYHQALPIHRLIFHPELGRPSLADNVFVRSLTHGIERLASSVLPRWAWAYVHVRAVYRAAPG